jgi:hypothetical protein
VSTKLTYAVELLRTGLTHSEIAGALGWTVRETERFLAGNPLRLPERVVMTKPLGDHRHVVAAFAGPFMRIAHFEDANQAASTARDWERGVFPPHQIGELRRCLQPVRKEAPCAVPA